MHAVDSWAVQPAVSSYCGVLHGVVGVPWVGVPWWGQGWVSHALRRENHLPGTGGSRFPASAMSTPPPLRRGGLSCSWV